MIPLFFAIAIQIATHAAEPSYFYVEGDAQPILFSLPAPHCDLARTPNPEITFTPPLQLPAADTIIPEDTYTPSQIAGVCCAILEKESPDPMHAVSKAYRVKTLKPNAQDLFNPCALIPTILTSPWAQNSAKEVQEMYAHYVLFLDQERERIWSFITQNSLEAPDSPPVIPRGMYRQLQKLLCVHLMSQMVALSLSEEVEQNILTQRSKFAALIKETKGVIKDIPAPKNKIFIFNPNETRPSWTYFIQTAQIHMGVHFIGKALETKTNYEPAFYKQAKNPSATKAHTALLSFRIQEYFPIFWQAHITRALNCRAPIFAPEWCDDDNCLLDQMLAVASVDHDAVLDIMRTLTQSFEEGCTVEQRTFSHFKDLIEDAKIFIQKAQKLQPPKQGTLTEKEPLEDLPPFHPEL